MTMTLYGILILCLAATLAGEYCPTRNYDVFYFEAEPRECLFQICQIMAKTE